jgi:hypothetical protein
VGGCFPGNDTGFTGDLPDPTRPPTRPRPRTSTSYLVPRQPAFDATSHWRVLSRRVERFHTLYISYGDIYPGDPEKGERSSLFRVLARTPFNSSVRPKICPASRRSARLRPAAAGSRRVGGRSGSQPSLHLPSTCARAPFAARLDARALRWSCARTPKSDQLVPALRRTDGAECARVLRRWCGGEGADAARRAAQPAPNVVPRPAA